MEKRPVPNVGNDFVVRQPVGRVATTQPVAAVPVQKAVMTPAVAAPLPTLPLAVLTVQPATRRRLRQLWLRIERASFMIFAVLFLLIGSLGIRVAGSYWQAHVLQQQAVTGSMPSLTANTAYVSTHDLTSRLQRITNQSISLQFGDKSIAIPAATIGTWVKTTSRTHDHAFIHADAAAITKEVNSLASPYIKAAVNQIVVTHDGQAPRTIAAGTNGMAITNLAAVATQITNNVLTGNGMHLNMQLQPVNFAISTPKDFPKLLEVDLTNKRMYAYENGNLVQTFLVSAGAPATPTPVGQFKIWTKLTVQDMKGRNPNGTPYFQPHVHWVNYFDHNGDAIHGNYWRPASVFGNVNTSHGCVSVPDDQAKWIYDWAPVGTTVVTYL